jgi:hypothetical protein
MAMLTRSDVEHRLADYGTVLPRGAVTVGATPTVTRLELVTRAEAEVMLNASLAGTPGISKDAHVWYIELQGTFSPAHISRPPGMQWNGMMCDVALLVLDAESGNVLVRALRCDRPT